MTEEEWKQQCHDPRAFLQLLSGLAVGRSRETAILIAYFNNRRLRLFAAACCRHVQSHWQDERVRLAVEAAETSVEARTNDERRLLKRIRARIFEDKTWMHTTEGRLARAVIGGSEGHAAVETSWQASYLMGGATFHSDEVRREQLPLLHDIFGNPFRPVAFDPAWRTSTALGVAQQMYDARDFAAMPILADALQDVGCEAADILQHCRDTEQVHVRGCWVVDLVLNKS